MYILIGFLIIGMVIFCVFAIRPAPSGRAWLKWDVARKTNYVTRHLSNTNKKGYPVKNTPLYYVTEMDRFYYKDDMNMDYDIVNVLANLVRIHEQH